MVQTRIGCPLLIVCIALLHPSRNATCDEPTWTRITVPGAWETQGEGNLGDYDGFGWYRCYVKVPEKWTDLAGRPLWYESVTLTVSRLADAHEVYVNGRRIGGAGALPPEFIDAQDEVRRYKVPPGILEAGKYNTIALRVYNQSGDGGFVGDAPVLAGYFLEAVLKGAWEFRTGVDAKWATNVRSMRPDTAVLEWSTAESAGRMRPAGWNSGHR